MAVVVLKEGAALSLATLAAHCRAHLASFKVPKGYEFCELPQTSTGKIQKYVLRAKAKSATAIE